MATKEITITGASQRTQANGLGEWQAVYICHKCGEEFAPSSEFCRNEKTARDESDARFDIQQRRFCYRCGHKLTTKEPVPENIYLALLNGQIDTLINNRHELMRRIKILKDTLNGMSDAERIAIANGWIRAVPEPDEVKHAE